MIRIFVGCSANNEDLEAYAVLEWSLRKHASEPVEITWMRLSRDPKSLFYSHQGAGWRTGHWATPFSGFRWAVPFLSGYQGCAIYVDYDFIFFDDVTELWREEIPEPYVAVAKGSNRLCLTLFDCARARKVLPIFSSLKYDPESHAKLCRTFRQWVKPFESGDWNCLDGVGYPDLHVRRPAALHYTSMNHQPHLEYALPRLEAEGAEHWFDGPTEKHWRPDVREVFAELLDEARANGYDPERYRVAEPYGPHRKRSFAR